MKGEINMKILNEIQIAIAIANDFALIKSIDIYNNDKEIISGFFKEAKFMPLEVSLYNHQISKAECSYKFLSLNKAIKVKLNYHNGKTKEFE